MSYQRSDVINPTGHIGKTWEEWIGKQVYVGANWKEALNNAKMPWHPCAYFLLAVDPASSKPFKVEMRDILGNVKQYSFACIVLRDKAREV